MKKAIFILFAAAMATVSVAQGPPEKGPKKNPEERAENMTRRLTKELDLSPEQQVKTKAIILKREQDRDKLQSQMREEHEKVKAEFKEFLNSEQFKKFEQKEEEMKKRREERREEGKLKRTKGSIKPEEK
jgi:Spy/CpxP family protein refolding chaperone